MTHLRRKFISLLHHSFAGQKLSGRKDNAATERFPAVSEITACHLVVIVIINVAAAENFVTSVRFRDVQLFSYPAFSVAPWIAGPWLASCYVLWQYIITGLQPIHIRLSYMTAPKHNKNSSGDEIANVNFFYNIAHVEASDYAHW